MRTFHLTIATIGQNLFDGEALSVTLPGKEGVFQVLANHESFVSDLRTGTIRVATETGEQSFPIERGVAEVSNNQATVLL